MARKGKRVAQKSDTLIRRRIEVLLIIFSLLVIALIGRVGYWQIFKADWLKQDAQDQWTREIRIFADRGDILDRNGNPLAISTRCYTVSLNPKAIKSQYELSYIDSEDYLNSLSNDLAQILEISPEDVKKYAQKEQSYVVIKRNVTDEQSDAIRLLSYEYTVENEGVSEQKTRSYQGISINEDIKREYPMGSFLTQVLGFTSIDGVGLEGIESKFDNDLRGINGKLIVETDRDGVKISGSYEERTEPVDGDNLQLTIDSTLQSFAESALDLCVFEQDAKSASIIVMDPNTGAVLAMATKPDYDNNFPPRNDLELLRELTKNKAVTNSYEPDSLFKLVTMAAAIDSGVATTNSHYDCPGYRVIDEQKVNCSSITPHGYLNLTQALQNSCNSSFMDMASGMGTNIFYDYIDKFGFGEKTGIKLYGESSGDVKAEKYVKDVDLARTGFGQAMSATPLQLITAVAAIANGGDVMQPYIAEKIISPEGDVLEQYTSEIRNEVIGDDTSDTMLHIMYEIVENGIGRNCKIGGYEIGGMAATSQKYSDDGLVLHDRYVSSFISVAPTNNPQLVVLITVDEPKAGGTYGSTVAAPYAKDFLEEALPYLNILPNYALINNLTKIEVPDVTNMTLEDAKKELSDKGFGCISEGFDGKIVTQIPRAGTMLERGANVIVQLFEVNDYGESYLVEVPDLFGLTPTEALTVLDENNLTMRIVSSGNVVMEQSPSKGTEVYRGSQVAVEFEYFEKKDDETDS